MNQIRNMLVFLLAIMPVTAYCQADSFSLYFATGKAQLDMEQRARLDSLLYSGQLAGNVDIRITGYADEPGTAALNKSLAQQRAASVRAYLIASGMKGGQILSCTGVGNRVSAEQILKFFVKRSLPSAPRPLYQRFLNRTPACRLWAG